LVVLAAKGAAALLGLGLAVWTLGHVLSVVHAGVVVFSAVLSALTSPLGLTAIAILGIGAALAAGVYLWVKYTKSGQEAAAELSARWAELVPIFTEAWEGIIDAVEAGDLAAAFDVAWAGVKAAFLTGTKDLRKTWVNFSSYFQMGWEQLTA